MLVSRRGEDWNVCLRGGGGRGETTMRNEDHNYILPILCICMRYPEDHKFDHKDEIEAEEEVY